MSLKTAALATAAASKAPSAEKTAASSSLKTSLEHTHHLLNYAELPITAAAYSTRQSRCASRRGGSSWCSCAARTRRCRRAGGEVAAVGRSRTFCGAVWMGNQR